MIDLMDLHGISEKKIMEKLIEAYTKNFHFSSGKILGSMCTEPHRIAVKSHMMFIDSNLGNPGLYPGTKELENAVVKMLASLYHGDNVTGYVLSGGSESNLTALWIARNITGKKEVIFSRSAHFSFIKSCDILGLRPVMINPDSDYKISVDDVKKKITKDTCVVIGIAGTTDLGVIDPIEELSDICENNNIFLHVDAAFGGFVLPFLKRLGYKIEKFDFELEGVTSITTDPHKMGCSTMPSSVFLIRDKNYFDKISVESPYLTVRKHTTILGTRCSASVPGTYAIMKLLGIDGYIKLVKRCMDVTMYLVNRLNEINVEIVVDPPPMNIVAIKLQNLDYVFKKLSENWCISVSEYPRSLRVVVMPHVTIDVVNRFVDDLEKLV
jgi:tyrosine decarboxylase/aspartate 1-decarboxylase